MMGHSSPLIANNTHSLLLNDWERLEFDGLRVVVVRWKGRDEQKVTLHTESKGKCASCIKSCGCCAES